MTRSLRVRVEPSIKAIPAEAWDACAAVAAESNSQVDPHNPFTTHAFLSSLEDSGAATARTGWGPRHLVVEDDGGVLAVMPAYLKSHSQGEYVFDHGWAEAFERVGGDYYPKLQVAVPFTPVSGPRLLARAGPLAAAVRGGLADALAELTTNNELSSAHVTFLTELEWREL